MCEVCLLDSNVVVQAFRLVLEIAAQEILKYIVLGVAISVVSKPSLDMTILLYYIHTGIPSYNWLNDDEHGVRQTHATSFPNGCALGAMWDKKVMGQVGQAVGQEARALHNELVHTGEQATDCQ